MDVSPTNELQCNDHQEKGGTVIHTVEREYYSEDDMHQELEKEVMLEMVPSPSVHQWCDECKVLTAVQLSSSVYNECNNAKDKLLYMHSYNIRTEHEGNITKPLLYSPCHIYLR